MFDNLPLVNQYVSFATSKMIARKKNQTTVLTLLTTEQPSFRSIKASITSRPPRSPIRLSSRSSSSKHSELAISLQKVCNNEQKMKCKGPFTSSDCDDVAISLLNLI